MHFLATLWYKAKTFSSSFNSQMGFSVIFRIKTNNGLSVISNLFIFRVKLKTLETLLKIFLIYFSHCTIMIARALFNGSFKY